MASISTPARGNAGGSGQPGDGDLDLGARAGSALDLGAAAQALGPRVSETLIEAADRVCDATVKEG